MTALLAANVRAWGVRFAPAAGAQGSVVSIVAEFREPFARVALAEPLPQLPPTGSHDLVFVFVPAGTDFAPYETWFQQDGPHGAAAQTLDVSVPDRVLWRPGRAVMFGSAERHDDTLAALAAFAFFEGQVRALETALQQRWPAARQDVALTHRATPAMLAEWPRVGASTEWAALSRMMFVALDTFLDVPPEGLSARARRILIELANMTRMTDRLRAIDDQVEVFEDLYELANDRLSEFSYYRGEYKLEVWIIVILVAEVALLLVEIFRR
jgi:hypothetical protein